MFITFYLLPFTSQFHPPLLYSPHFPSLPPLPLSSFWLACCSISVPPNSISSSADRRLRATSVDHATLIIHMWQRGCGGFGPQRDFDFWEVRRLSRAALFEMHVGEEKERKELRLNVYSLMNVFLTVSYVLGKFAYKTITNNCVH